MLIKGINGQQLDFGRVKMEAGFFERATVVPCFSLSLDKGNTVIGIPSVMCTITIMEI